jgi:plasmid stabilization system protein ParE
MRRVVLTAQARSDLFAQLDWLVTKAPPAARAAAMRLEQALIDLEHFPEIGLQTEAGYRERFVRFGRDGFIIRYLLGSDRVEILRIFGGRQLR